MITTMSSKGQLVLPVAARRKLRLSPGERLSVELREDGIFLRPFNQAPKYDVQAHPTSGLVRMVPKVRPKHKVTPEEIARLNAELL